MPEFSDKTTSKNVEQDVQVPVLHDDAWRSGSLNQLRDIVKSTSSGVPVQELTVTRVSDTDAAPLQKKNPQDNLIPPALDKNLKDVQNILQETQKQIAELRLHYDKNLYDMEQSRRGVFSNPYKLMTVGTGAMVFRSSPGLAAVPLTGFAALQGYDDFKNMKDALNWQTRGKYSMGLVADAAIGAGALGFLSESVPMRYKAPLLIGGFLVRSALDFVPNKR